MSWQVVMEEDGIVTLPPELVARLGWSVETALCWSDDENGMRLGPAKTGLSLVSS